MNLSMISVIPKEHRDLLHRLEKAICKQDKPDALLWRILKSHINSALFNGLTQEEVTEINALINSLK